MAAARDGTNKHTHTHSYMDSIAVTYMRIAIRMSGERRISSFILSGMNGLQKNRIA
jgi:hypothetical protein